MATYLTISEVIYLHFKFWIKTWITEYCFIFYKQHIYYKQS